MTKLTELYIKLTESFKTTVVLKKRETIQLTKLTNSEKKN